MMYYLIKGGDNLELFENIKARRKALDMSQQELADKVGYKSRSTINKIEKGVNDITQSKIVDFAKALSTTPGELMGWQEDNRLKEPEITENVVSFPVIGTVAAGYDEIAIEDWTGDTVEIPLSYIKGRSSSDFFVLSVHGDSMYPLYMNGDKVLILKKSSLNKSGDIGVIMYDNECATLKKIEYTTNGDWLKLVPLNPEYQPKLLTGVQLEECRIIGVPFLLIRNLHK